ncbi:MAG TPA: response regulator transcription factor [Methylomirabilota bacterium]|jgi:DNA-binding NarL/FixJ family response regulator|nr:response regulator transcription factor [Methylomirabilota bacterium]
MAISLLLADDHPLILQGLQNLFGREPDFTVVGQCRTGDEALDGLRRHWPDILLLDLRMPGTDGLAVLRQMKEEKMATRVVLLTAALDEEDVLEAMRLGVRGVVLKEMAPRLLVQCIRKVHAGGEWLETRSFSRALDKLLKREARPGDMATILTARELEIARMVARGLRNRDIAEKLSISEGTVKIHLHRTYEKLGVDGRLQLMLYVQKNGPG